MLMFIIIFGASLSIFVAGLYLSVGGAPISFKDPVKLLESDTPDEDRPFNAAEALKDDPLAQEIDALSNPRGTGHTNDSLWVYEAKQLNSMGYWRRGIGIRALELWKISGVSAEEFCARTGINSNRFQYWIAHFGTSSATSEIQSSNNLAYSETTPKNNDTFANKNLYLYKNLNFKESNLRTKILYTTTRDFNNNEN